MNIKDIGELVEATELLDQVGEYVIRKFIASDNYVIIDNLGDFIVLERDIADQICSILWNDIAPQEKLN
jgi:nucleoside-triphosphatase THEP1